MCRMDHVAWKFVRLVAIFTLSLVCLVLTHYVMNRGWMTGGWANASAGATAATGMAAFFVLTLAPMAERMSTIVRGLCLLGAVAGLVAASSWGFKHDLWPLDMGSRLPLIAALLGQGTSAFLMGSVALATTLGHAYLTQTAMPVAALRRLAKLFAGAMVLRGLWTLVVGGGLLWWGVAQEHLTIEAIRHETLLLLIRTVVGLLIPTIFAFMVLVTARLRATQSATGILYFAMVLICIGELTSLSLMNTLGVSL